MNHPYEDNIDEPFQALVNFTKELCAYKLPVFDLYPSAAYIPYGTEIFHKVLNDKMNFKIQYITIPKYLAPVAKVLPRDVKIFIEELPLKAKKIRISPISKRFMTKDEVLAAVYRLWSSPIQIADYLAHVYSHFGKISEKELKILGFPDEAGFGSRHFLYLSILGRYVSRGY